jgi:AcrR family transcriptional regulator
VKQQPAKLRILAAAEELFAKDGFDATPTSRIAEVAKVPKGLVHYYFRRKPDLLRALVDQLPDEEIIPESFVVPGDIGESLRRLVAELDRRLNASRVLSHLLWREADTHSSVQKALHERYRVLVSQVRAVIIAAAKGTVAIADVDSAAGLLALAVSYRHSVARHAEDDQPDAMEHELKFIANALTTRSQPA